MKKRTDSQKVMEFVATGFYNAGILINHTKKYYKENWKDDVDRGIAKVRSMWNENVGIDINWQLVFALLFLPTLIKYCFEFWCALLMFVTVVYVYFKVSGFIKE